MLASSPVSSFIVAWVLDRSHQLSRPSADGLAALVREVAPRSKVVRWRRLGGGLSTATHVVDVRSAAGNITAFVVKRYRPGDTSAPEEWAKLRFAQGVDVPSPEPVALDRRGEWFGTPAVVMTKLSGRPYLSPSDPDAYLGQLAEAQLTIQSASVARAPVVIRRVRSRPDQPPWTGLRPTELVERAADIVERGRPAALASDLRLGHGDLHPGNTVWARGKLAGIADWRHAAVAPRAYEVAYTRVDLSVLFGPTAADRFLDEYLRRWGGELEHLDVFDLGQGLAAIRWAHYWALAYREQGRRDLTDAKAKCRARDFVRRVLERRAG